MLLHASSDSNEFESCAQTLPRQRPRRTIACIAERHRSRKMSLGEPLVSAKGREGNVTRTASFFRQIGIIKGYARYSRSRTNHILPTRKPNGRPPTFATGESRQFQLDSLFVRFRPLFAYAHGWSCPDQTCTSSFELYQFFHRPLLELQT